VGHSNPGLASADKTSYSPAAKHRAELFYLALVGALIISLLVITWIVGYTHRVTYLGPDNGPVQTAGEVSLRTEPAADYRVARNAIYAAMKAGCRYDLNYSPEFGTSRGAKFNYTRYVRRATLVDCP
jgi:hypothetical protein